MEKAWRELNLLIYSVPCLSLHLARNNNYFRKKVAETKLSSFLTNVAHVLNHIPFFNIKNGVRAKMKNFII